MSEQEKIIIVSLRRDRQNKAESKEELWADWGQSVA